MKRLLIACECSGVVRRAFAARGWDAWSCDIKPAEDGSDRHHQCDVRHVIGQRWDRIIAHPDCTYLANSGVRWLMEDAVRWRMMWDACEFFRLFLNHDCPEVAIENPVPHKYAARWIGTPYTQTIQPWQFGHGETKRTCLWLKGLPRLQSTNIVEGRYPRVHLELPGPDRKANRSRTYPGIAEAMAQQWSIPA